MPYVFANGTVLTMGETPKIFKKGCVVVEGDEIVDVGEHRALKSKYKGYEKINCDGKIIMPPLINCHTHASMTLLRGYADDVPLIEWLTKWIFPVEKNLKPEDIYLGTQLAAIESALSGTSTLNTMYYFMDKEAEAISEIGLRAVVGHVCFSNTKRKDNNETYRLVKKWHNSKNGLIRVSVDPHSIYTVDPEYLIELFELKNDLNEKYGSEKAPIFWHIHTAETQNELNQMKEAFKKSNSAKIKQLINHNYDGVFDYLNSLGVLGPDILAAHCVHLTEKDIALLRKNDIKVAHNPVSNLKLASGISPVSELLNSNITVGLGTDGACSNNTLDMFETVKFAALIQKGFYLNPTLIPAFEAIKMATLGGAKALFWDNEIGSLEVGKKADILVVECNTPHLTPLFNEYSHLTYAVKSSDVKHLMVNGKLVVENRDVKTVKVEYVMSKVRKWKEDRLNQ